MGEEKINSSPFPLSVDYDGGASVDRSKSLDRGGIFSLSDSPKLVSQLVAGKCRLLAAAQLMSLIGNSDRSHGGSRPLAGVIGLGVRPCLTWVAEKRRQ